MGLVEKAERKSRARAIIGYLLAATLLASAILAIRGHSDGAARLAPWFVMIALTALNLTALPFRWNRCGPVSQLMNDETTCDHRRSSLAAGFWAMLAAAAATIIVGSLLPLDTIAAGRIVITAGLMAALIAFSTLELRASR
ncbi:putative membrane protein [Sphingomonas sp. S17]|jgi:hypothetical protein|uniref:Uncharacterized protein n=2 Tax=Sphingomonas paucimobilis TaxID=13689 RepID=A0A411LKX8_SPHPI|nr:MULTISPECIES: hypothetical protein [Sphingomonas]EGI53820.1 putative membrane protein [Sphingomonas sp. S17]MBQ1480516.1 hypothetical protein [Sphingomonas sp.]MCM3680417.1 hypothetical protein [Sphingomonas paucimobilis]MDG5970167.1 hypothetical protein [Sphingomonas paucimobilis]NNG58511.1 hypothetical protein [Sphingomonas paucimobilis]